MTTIDMKDVRSARESFTYWQKNSTPGQRRPLGGVWGRGIYYHEPIVVLPPEDAPPRFSAKPKELTPQEQHIAAGSYLQGD